jgi:hypothetical protein
VAEYWGEEFGWCEGKIVAADDALVRVQYSDGDVEEIGRSDARRLLAQYTSVFVRINEALAKRPAWLPTVSELQAMSATESSALQSERQRKWAKTGLGKCQVACKQYGIWCGGNVGVLRGRLWTYETRPFQMNRSDFEELKPSSRSSRVAGVPSVASRANTAVKRKRVQPKTTRQMRAK